MRPWRTLRGRLTLSMSLVFILALAASTLLDRFEAETPAVLPGVLHREPYQDGLVLALFSLPALVLIWLVSSWSLRPLLRASTEAQRAGPADPAARLSREGMPAEVAPLVDAVNGALDRMTRAFEAERRFTENAAHELRTPLAVLGLRLQRARGAARADPMLDWPAIEADLAQMNRLVGQLLDLARKENAGRLAPASGAPPVNLSRVAREAAASVLPLVDAAGRALHVDLPDALWVTGRAHDLADALRNLLENALLHGEGDITLRAEAAAGGYAVIEVGDEGPGIGEQARDTMFQRFAKGAGSSGSGLGLAIVREVARGHGGDVTLAPSPGCRLRLTLPATHP